MNQSVTIGIFVCIYSYAQERDCALGFSFSVLILSDFQPKIGQFRKRIEANLAQFVGSDSQQRNKQTNSQSERPTTKQKRALGPWNIEHASSQTLKT